IPDEAFARAGATLVDTAEDVWARADLILKVKEPQPQEFGRLRKGQILFTYLHLAAHRDVTDALIRAGAVAIAYETVEDEGRVLGAGVVVGAVLVAGARARELVSEDVVSRMRPGSVIVDISIDQGGCFATSHVTTHTNPTYVTHGVVHYCVGNMPGAVPHTSTYALTNATLPYALALSRKGLRDALRHDPALAKGVNVYEQNVTNAAVAEAHGLPFTPLDLATQPGS